MTENEAIEFIKNANALSKRAIHDLEEIKDKAERIGKIGEYYANLENCYKEIEACEIAINALEEIKQYRAVGTVEECREARERKKRGKVNNRTPLRDLNGNLYTVRGDCPNCGNIGLLLNTDYCNACGQKLDWSE